MTIRIRKARVEDAVRVADLWHEMAVFHGRLGDEWRIRRGSREGFASYVEGLIGEGRDGVFVAHDDGPVVGFVIARRASRARIFAHRDHGLISDLAVSRAYRRRGVGSRLCRRAFRWIGARGLGTAEVRFAAANPLAAAFWREMGFETRVIVAVRAIPGRKPPADRRRSRA